MFTDWEQRDATYRLELFEKLTKASEFDGEEGSGLTKEELDKLYELMQVDWKEQMKLKTVKYDVGVVVGRFQVDKLHSAHVNLLQSVSENHHKVILFLGVPPTLGTKENPLSFNQRRQMVETLFPNLIILPINDRVSNFVWSKNLDSAISTIIPNTQSVVLYGGRESFIPKYSGRFPTLEFENEGFFSGTEIRKTASVQDINSDDFRAGVISGVSNQYPKVFTTVDIAIFRKNELLLGRKPDESLFRFIGGFAEPDSDSFEIDGKRVENWQLVLDDSYNGKVFKVGKYNFRKIVFW